MTSYMQTAVLVGPGYQVIAWRAALLVLILSLALALIFGKLRAHL